MSQYAELEKAMGHVFTDPKLLVRALTHRSFRNESKRVEHDNQRLEFLGDAVLGLVISELIFEAFPDCAEGRLSKIRAELVCEPALAKVARALDLGTHMRLGKGEESSGGRTKESVLSDAYEALIAALHLDGGLDVVRTFIAQRHGKALKSVSATGQTRDAKSQLQELVQARNAKHPTYHLVSTTGLPHERVFTVRVQVDGEVAGEGAGNSKKQAQQAAARDALTRLQLSGE